VAGKDSGWNKPYQRIRAYVVVRFMVLRLVVWMKSADLLA
jgi:hypothetical protein